MYGMTHRPPSILSSAIRYWWIVVVATVVGAVLAYGVSQRRDVVVPAEGQIVLADIRTPTFDSSDITSSSKARVADEALRARNRAVFEAAAQKAGVSYEAMRATVKVETDPDGSSAILVQGKAGTENASVDRVNAVIDAYREAARAAYSSTLDQVQAQVQADLDATNEQLVARRADFAALATDNPARNDTQRDIQLLQNTVNTRTLKLTSIASARTTYGDGIAFENRAEGASGPAQPNVQRNTAVGAGLGLLLGLGVAWSVADRKAWDESRSSGRRRRSSSSGHGATEGPFRLKPSGQTAELEPDLEPPAMSDS